jgi:hypothetical protein
MNNPKGFPKLIQGTGDNPIIDILSSKRQKSILKFLDVALLKLRLQ